MEEENCDHCDCDKNSRLSIPLNLLADRSPSLSSALNPVDEEILKRMSILEKPTGWKRYLGIILTILSAITFSFNALIAKLLNHYDPFNLGVWTFQLMTYFSVIHLLVQSIKRQVSPIFKDIWPFTQENGKNILYLWIRAVCGVCALTFFFFAMKYVELGDALIIDSSSPIFVYIMAYVFLGEKCGVLPIFTTILAFIGVALITRPPMLTGTGVTEYNMNNLIGSALAFACMMCITFSIIALKFLENVNPGIINMALGGWGTVQSVTLAVILGALELPNNLNDICKIAATAVLFFIGQALITTALQFEDAGPVALVRTCEIFFAFLWQFLFLDVVPDIYSLIGAFFILNGVILTILRKWVDSLPLEHSRRKTLSFLLI